MRGHHATGAVGAVKGAAGGRGPGVIPVLSRWLGELLSGQHSLAAAASVNNADMMTGRASWLRKAGIQINNGKMSLEFIPMCGDRAAEQGQTALRKPPSTLPGENAGDRTEVMPASPHSHCSFHPASCSRSPWEAAHDGPSSAWASATTWENQMELLTADGSPVQP